MPTPFFISSGVDIGTGITIEYIYPGPPINDDLPVTSGTPQVRVTINVTTGVWTSFDGPITYSYQWQHGTTNIPGATSNSYDVSYLYVDDTLRCEVTATNSLGSTSVFTINTPLVLANIPADPTAVVATMAGASPNAEIAITPNVDDGGRTIIAYHAVSNVGGISGSNATSPVTVGPLDYDTSYTFDGSTQNVVGNSNPVTSNVVTFNLTPTSVATTSTTDKPVGIVISPSGEHVYVQTEGPKLRFYDRNTSTGALTLNTVYPISGVGGVTFPGMSGTPTTMRSDGQYIYCTRPSGGSGNSAINSFSRNTTTGALTGVVSTIPGIGFLESAISSDDNLYVMGRTVGSVPQIKGYDISSAGGFTAGSSITFSLAAGSYQCRGIQVSPDNTGVYVILNNPANTLKTIYIFDKSGGTITLNTSVVIPSTFTPLNFIISQDNESLYIFSAVAPEILHYNRDTTTNLLTLVGTTTPTSIAGSLDGLELTNELMLVSNSGSFNRDTTNGNLSLNSVQSPVTSAGSNYGLIVSPDDLNIYAIDATNNDIIQYDNI